MASGMSCCCMLFVVVSPVVRVALLHGQTCQSGVADCAQPQRHLCDLVTGCWSCWVFTHHALPYRASSGILTIP